MLENQFAIGYQLLLRTIFIDSGLRKSVCDVVSSRIFL